MRKADSVRVALFILVAILGSALALAMSCDCNPTGNQNRVCLFTTPQTLTIQDDHFDFAINIRNFFRSETESITGITTTVESCTRSGGGSCTWSESGSTDFLVTINPRTIASSPGGDYGDCGQDPASCRSCGTGRLETVNSRITINNAADGTYVLRYKVSWNPRALSRYIDVTISFTSSGGCTQNSDCPGQICCSSSCVAPACTSASGCGTPPVCRVYTCANSGTCSAQCTQSNAADGTTCSGGRCTNGQCTAGKPGDLNGDGRVNIFDLVLVAKDYGKSSGFDPLADANKDGRINIFDLVEVARYYGT